MTATILEKILESKRRRLEAAKAGIDIEQSKKEALVARSGTEAFRLRKALSRNDRTNIIAEIKRASPSKGIINTEFDIVDLARSYEKGGACAISVLTEEDHFGGSLNDLRTVRKAVGVPILRKDFIIGEFQIYETAAAGADAILLIVAALTSGNLQRFQRLAHALGLDTLVEVHNADELDIAKSIGPTIIGVNNRNLHTFEVSLDASRDLIKHKPDGSLMISESGLASPLEISELKTMGFDGFLIGETLMRSGNAERHLKELTERSTVQISL